MKGEGSSVGERGSVGELAPPAGAAGEQDGALAGECYGRSLYLRQLPRIVRGVRFVECLFTGPGTAFFAADTELERIVGYALARDSRDLAEQVRLAVLTHPDAHRLEGVDTRFEACRFEGCGFADLLLFFAREHLPAVGAGIASRSQPTSLRDPRLPRTTGVPLPPNPPGIDPPGSRPMPPADVPNLEHMTMRASTTLTKILVLALLFGVGGLASRPAHAGEADPMVAIGNALNPGGQALRSAPPVGPAVRPDDHKLTCGDLRREHAALGDREVQLAQAESSASTRTDVAGFSGFFAGIVGQAGAVLSSVTAGGDDAVRVERAAVAARRDRVAVMMNERRC